MPHPLLEVPRTLFDALIVDLAKSGRGVKESGAFLLGGQDSSRRFVTSYLMYDKVAPQSSSRHAYVAFTAEEMARAWEHCYAAGLQVVADVHTHPFGPAQSISDRAHPIVSIAGHLALIVPNFAQLEQWAGYKNIIWTERPQLLEMPLVRAKMEKEVRNELAGLASFETPKKIALLTEDFSIERGELTPTLKVKRRVIDRDYTKVIDALYAEPHSA